MGGSRIEGECAFVHVSALLLCIMFSESVHVCVSVCISVCGSGVLGKVNSCSSRYRKPLISANENCRPY